MMAKELTHQMLRRLMRYEPKTGLFTRLVHTNQNAKVGDIAGTIHPNGYRRIGIRGRIYKAARLAVFYVTGGWPVGDVDHEDGDRANDAWDNLRPATRSQNIANSRLSAANKSGLKGVSRKDRRWRAALGVGYRQQHLGIFDCPAAAHFAYIVAANKAFGVYARSA